MSLPIKTPIRVQNPDGSMRDDFNYSFADPADPTGQTPHPDFLGHIVMTGPIAGTVSLKNGKTFDVTPKYIHCLPEEGGQIACIIHRLHNANNDAGFEPHVHTEACGPEGASPSPVTPSA
jgi:hypothetical protein